MADPQPQLKTFGAGASPLAECDTWLRHIFQSWREEMGRPIAIGISGAQGSGKSTLAARLARQLVEDGVKTELLSLDDYYLPLSERRFKAANIHPLFATRGVPGTHDLALARYHLETLLDPATRLPTGLPIFDKLSDDRLERSRWRDARGPVDILLFEGWCVGARPQPRANLVEPVNELEAHEDRGCQWRGHVNDELGSTYQDFFDLLDRNVFLRAPSFEVVARWRGEQERGLLSSGSQTQAMMDSAALVRFVAHFERLARWMLKDEPADLVLDIDERRTPKACRTGYTGRRSPFRAPSDVVKSGLL